MRAAPTIRGAYLLRMVGGFVTADKARQRDRICTCGSGDPSNSSCMPACAEMVLSNYGFVLAQRATDF